MNKSSEISAVKNTGVSIISIRLFVILTVFIRNIPTTKIEINRF